jgi:UDP-3-O-[3-hydroxymyristoyl] glucosamine N-acyltransferase
MALLNSKIFYMNLALEIDQNNQDQNIIDIKDLQNSKSNEITFFHSKKYKKAANNTKASFCLTTKNLQNELPTNCIPIIVDNVLVSTSIVTSKFYPDAIKDDFDVTVDLKLIILNLVIKLNLVKMY